MGVSGLLSSATSTLHSERRHSPGLQEPEAGEVSEQEPGGSTWSWERREEAGPRSWEILPCPVGQPWSLKVSLAELCCPRQLLLPRRATESAAGGSRSALPKLTWEIQQYPKPPAHSWGVYISIIQMGLARKMARGLGMVP